MNGYVYEVWCRNMMRARTKIMFLGERVLACGGGRMQCRAITNQCLRRITARVADRIMGEYLNELLRKMKQSCVGFDGA